jgi:hypothetical protein
MKLNVYEAHDRKDHFIQDQSANIFQGADDCMKRNPLSLALQSRSPYIYLFAHPRTDDDGVTKKMFWQPRLTKPAAQTNSYLFRAQSNTDLIEICWLLPPRELWPQYEDGNVTESQDVKTSIINFVNWRQELEMPHKDDLPDHQIRIIYKEIDAAMHKPKFTLLI